MNLSFCVRLLIFGVVHASEWFTSGGNHCTERCKIRPTNDLGEFFWCPVVDGFHLDHNKLASSRPSKHDQHNAQTGEKKIKWDYCTPAVSTDMIEGEESETNSTKNKARKGQNVNAVKRPTKLSASSLAGKVCMGPCRKESEEKFQCDIPGSSPDRFYCSPEFVLQRNQISSQKKLWCTGPCLAEYGGDHYECMTLFGSDRCIPTADTSTGMKALEYTVGDQICASKCEDVDGNRTCSYVKWELKDDTRMASLTLNLGSCVPYTHTVQKIGAQVGVGSGNLKRSKRENTASNITTESTNTDTIQTTNKETEITNTETETTDTENKLDRWKGSSCDKMLRWAPNTVGNITTFYNTTTTQGYTILGYTFSKYDNWWGIYVDCYNVSTPEGEVIFYNERSDCSINNICGQLIFVAQVYGVTMCILLGINLWNWPKPKPLTRRWWGKVKRRENREYVVVELFWSFFGVCYFSFVFGWAFVFNFYGNLEWL
eukprot:GFUD01096254.1.p1 GENE.GFUD01096254.1~~GFUD01096254.1.p1  ORF type:complete len:486 (-),score=52.67 GFUD01096254.1:148-1605(-)